MLRVKKEYFNEEKLKEFGYIKSDIVPNYYTHCDKKVFVNISEDRIRVMNPSNDNIDILYDLISAGIVEKVPYERRKKKTKEQDRIDKAIDYINEMTLTSDGYANYGDDLRPEHIIDILKGEE